MEDETAHHAVTRCTKAYALRQELRKVWDLPHERKFEYTGPDWLLVLMGSVQREQGAHILLLFWRAWHLRNDIVHGKGTDTVIGSVHFLQSYNEFMLLSRKSGSKIDEKGKGKLHDQATKACPASGRATGVSATTHKWEPPPPNWVKINIDAGYLEMTCEASSGVLIRNSEGMVLLSAWRILRRCSSALEAEAEACLEGIRLAADWIREPSILESDCWNLVDLLKEPQGRTSWEGIMKEIQAAGQLLPEVQFSRTRRDSNKAAHLLAQLALKNKEFVVQRFNFPSCISSVVESELLVCNNITSGNRESGLSGGIEYGCNHTVP